MMCASSLDRMAWQTNTSYVDLAAKGACDCHELDIVAQGNAVHISARLN